MLIVSPFHDYYDTAIGFGGVDKSIVYNRQPRCISARENPQEYEEIRNVLDLDHDRKDLFHALLMNESHVEEAINCSCWQVAVVFCGRVYHAVCFDPEPYYDGIGPHRTRNSKSKVYEERTFIYDPNELPKEINPNKLFRRVLGREKRVDPAVFFGNNGTEKHMDWAIEKGLVTAYYLARRWDDRIFIEDILKEIQFYKVFDAFSAFQEVSMFVGNLARPDRETVEISDQDQISEKGFDLKSSFRKPKGEKKPRRK